MKIYRAIRELPKETPRTVAAIGNFDGVHRGHQEIIGRVQERAHALGSEMPGAHAIAVTFDPHPIAVLYPDRAPKLITPIAERLRLLEGTGLDATLVIPFTREFSMQSAREFAERTLCGALRVAEVHEGLSDRLHERSRTADERQRLLRCRPCKLAEHLGIDAPVVSGPAGWVHARECVRHLEPVAAQLLRRVLGRRLAVRGQQQDAAGPDPAGNGPADAAQAADRQCGTGRWRTGSAARRYSPAAGRGARAPCP